MRVIKLSCESRARAIKMSATLKTRVLTARDFDKVHCYYYLVGGSIFKSVNQKLFNLRPFVYV